MTRRESWDDDPPERDPDDFRCHECEAPLPIARVARGGGSRLCDDCRDERDRRRYAYDEGGEA